MPKQILLNDNNSFAVEDLRVQAKRVINTILRNNSFSQEKDKGLRDLQKSVLSNSPIARFKNDNNDIDPWDRIMKIKDNKHRWFGDYHHGLIVSYFHRLILDRIDYFKSGKDPYEKVKRQALAGFVRKFFLGKKKENINLKQILIGMLWGNKTDFVPPVISFKKILLSDDRNPLIKFLFEQELSRVDIISDNVGKELFYDILFIDFIFTHGLVRTVKYHVKNYPYNISDATKPDVFWTLDFLAASRSNFLKDIAKNILDLISKKKIDIITYPFTTLGLDRRLAMNVVRDQYAGSSLVITKGDFNYRKNLGWHYWGVKESYKEIISYLGVPLACFRVIKNEVLTGTNNKTLITALEKKDPNWWKKGKGGVIIFTVPETKEGKNCVDCGEIENFWGKTI